MPRWCLNVKVVYLQEMLTFLLLTTEAAVALAPPAKE